MCGTPLSSVVTTTSSCRFGKSIVPSSLANDLFMYALTKRNTMRTKTTRIPIIIKVIFVLFLFLSGLIGACFIGISITYPPCCYYINVGEGKCMEGRGTEGQVHCPGLYSNLRRGTMDLSPRPTKQKPAHPFYSSVQAFNLIFQFP